MTKCRNEIQEALQKEFYALEDDLLPQEYKEPTHKSDLDTEQSPIPTTEVDRAEMEEMIG